MMSRNENLITAPCVYALHPAKWAILLSLVALLGQQTLADGRGAAWPMHVIDSGLSGGDGVREVLALQDGKQLLSQAIKNAHEWKQQSADCNHGSSNNETPIIVLDKGKTDLANARRFADLHGDKVRYCHPWGKWLIWDGRRWKDDDTGKIVRLAKQVADSIWDEAKQAGNYGDEAEQKARNWAVKTSSKPRIDAMLSLAQSEGSIPVLPDQLDCDPWLLNCQNGTVDLRTGDIREHEQSDGIMKLSPTVFNPDAESYAW
ncbi:MAG: hypothetical protein IID32_00635, partial [Planctomycetes bacterium]|nr:hypothetical protein [Planctomycetota bacterium]